MQAAVINRTQVAVSLWRQLGQIASVAVAYFMLGELSFSLTVSHGIVTQVVFWAEGLALAAAILWGPRMGWGVALGQFVLALHHGLYWPWAGLVALINGLEAVLGVWLFRRLKLRQSLDRLRDLCLLLGLIVVVLQPFSATLGTLVLWQGGLVTTAGLEQSWLSWWSGNVLGQIILTPLMLSLAAFRAVRAKTWHSGLGLLGLALAVGWMLFSQLPGQGWLLDSLFVELMAFAVAARYGLVGASAWTAYLALQTFIYTQLGSGPFVHANDLGALNLFLLRLALIGQLTAVLFAERREELHALQLSRDQLNQAQHIAHLGSWSLNMIDYRLDWSDEIFNIFELDAQHVRPSYKAYMARCHPQDSARLLSTFEAAVAQHVPYELSHRLLFADGRIKHVRARGEVRYRRDGTPSLFTGTLLDVTDQADAEQQLRLYARIFAQSNDAIVLTNVDNQILDVNPSFTRLTGYTRDEVVGQNPRMLGSGKTPLETYQALWRGLNEQGYWSGELWDRRKDGTIYPKWASISVMRDEQGSVTHHVASFADISERKVNEEHIARLAYHDALTGLHNRWSLHQRLGQAVQTAHRENSHLAVLFFDMDHFKQINDTLGHHVGDLLLIEVAQRMRANARASDIVARLGGDEFVMVLTGLDGQAWRVIEPLVTKISESLAQPYQLEQREVRSNSSIGVSIYPEDGLGAELLMHHADVAMYHAKQAGRGRFRRYEHGMIADSGL